VLRVRHRRRRVGLGRRVAGRVVGGLRGCDQGVLLRLVELVGRLRLRQRRVRVVDADLSRADRRLVAGPLGARLPGRRARVAGLSRCQRRLRARQGLKCGGVVDLGELLAGGDLVADLDVDRRDGSAGSGEVHGDARRGGQVPAGGHRRGHRRPRDLRGLLRRRRCRRRLPHGDHRTGHRSRQHHHQRTVDDHRPSPHARTSATALLRTSTNVLSARADWCGQTGR
jgi:hypothetical protein